MTDKEKVYNHQLEKEITVKQSHQHGEATNLYHVATTLKKLDLGSELAKQEKFSKGLYQLLDELSIVVNESGTITSIANHYNILKKWEKVKRSALDAFKGPAVVKYLDTIEAKVQDENKLLGDINQYRLLGFLWNGLYRDYSSPVKRQKAHLQSINYLPLAVDETFTWLDDGTEDANPVYIEFFGEIEETGLSNKKINKFFRRKGYPSATFQLMQYEGLYEMDTATGWLRKGDFTMLASYGHEYVKSQTITIKRL
ncbi:MAG: hypothetical protein AAGI25_12705 [Bacteroidota bacterium]